MAVRPLFANWEKMTRADLLPFSKRYQKRIGPTFGLMLPSLKLWKEEFKQWNPTE